MLDEIVEANKDRLLCSNRTLYLIYSELQEYVYNPSNVANEDYVQRLITYDRLRLDLVKECYTDFR